MSLNDLLKYAEFHLGDGTGRDGTRVLSRASLDLMQTPRVRKNATDEDMGLGWHLRRVGGVLTAAHGGTLGHCLLVELVPERHLALAILTNHSSGWQLIQDVERAALKSLEGLALGSGAVDRPSRRQRNDAGRADPRDAAGSRAVCRRLSPAAVGIEHRARRRTASCNSTAVRSRSTDPTARS